MADEFATKHAQIARLLSELAAKDARIAELEAKLAAVDGTLATAHALQGGAMLLVEQWRRRIAGCQPWALAPYVPEIELCADELEALIRGTQGPSGLNPNREG